jgi:hypothetical protein
VWAIPKTTPGLGGTAGGVGAFLFAEFLVCRPVYWGPEEANAWVFSRWIKSGAQNGAQ